MYRVIGSESDCALDYQCRDDPGAEPFEPKISVLNSKMRNVIKEFNEGYGFFSLHHIMERFELPHEVPIEHFLISGSNFIDIHSENSGAGGGCALGIALDFQGAEGLAHTFRVLIDNDVGQKPSPNGPLTSDEVFHSGGDNTSVDTAGRLEPYLTYKSQHLMRVCQRIRIDFELTDSQSAMLNSESSFNGWASGRIKDAAIQLLLNEPKYCEHAPVGSDFVRRRHS
jgi:hypothetical protein